MIAHQGRNAYRNKAQTSKLGISLWAVLIPKAALEKTRTTGIASTYTEHPESRKLFETTHCAEWQIFAQTMA
jgi:hypothetical protein